MTKTRRYCRIEGCTKIVKSQGLCQRHGAKTRLCKVDGCPKQAQGNFDGMCKVRKEEQCNRGYAVVRVRVRMLYGSSYDDEVLCCCYNHKLTHVLYPSLILHCLQSHFKQSRVDLKETMVIPSTVPPPPSGQSVYDHIIPASIAFRSTDEKELMPLVAHLKQGFDENRPRGWHRNDERRARGLWPVAKAAVQLQGWERELVWMEICILSGNSQASFRHLARAWGRDKGFHMVLAQFICERRGNVERKQRPKGSAQRGGGANAFPEDFMNDILSFEDMDCMIEGMLGAESSDVDSESEGHGGGTATLQGQQQQQQTENVCSSHAQVVPHHQEGVHSYQDEKQQVAVAAAAAAATSAAAAHVVYSSVAHHHVAREAQSLVAHEQQQHEAADGYVDPLDVHLLMPLVHATEQQPAPTVTKQV